MKKLKAGNDVGSATTVSAGEISEDGAKVIKQQPARLMYGLQSVIFIRRRA